MKAYQREMAAELVRVADDFSGEYYRTLSDELNNSLAGNATGTTPDEAISNKSMIDEIVGTLPRWDTLTFGVDTPSQFRSLQSSVAWQHRYSSYGTVPPLPAYLIGAEQTGRRVDLLLHSPGNLPSPKDIDLSKQSDPSRMFIATIVANRRFRLATELVRRWRASSLTEEDMNAVYDDHTNKYVLNPHKIGTIQIATRRWAKRLGPASGVVLPVSRLSGDMTAISNDTLSRLRVLHPDRRLKHLLRTVFDQIP